MLPHNLLESPVFLLEGLQPLQLADGEADVFGLPVVVGGVAHPVLASEIGEPGSGIAFPEHGDDLFLGVPLCLQ